MPGRAIDGDIRDTRARDRGGAPASTRICHARGARVALWRRDPCEFDAINVGGLQSVARRRARARHLRRRLHLVISRAAAGRTERAAPANDYQRTKVRRRTRAPRGDAGVAGRHAVSRRRATVRGAASEGNLLGRLLRITSAAKTARAHRPGTHVVVHVDRRCRARRTSRRSSGAAPGSSYELGGGENVPHMRPFEIALDFRGGRLPLRLRDRLGRRQPLPSKKRARVSQQYVRVQ